METNNFNILFADDDADDCFFFKEALAEIGISHRLTLASNGEELINYLKKHSSNLPDVLFLDLNMPLKTGFECLQEIKGDKKLKQLPVIIYSTSAVAEIMELLYLNGAHYYIRKPADFTNLKLVIKKALLLCTENKELQPEKDDFVIQP